jgi:hypothetical protein
MKLFRLFLVAFTVFIVASCGSSKITRSPIEELSLAVGTNEIRAYGSAESPSEQLAYNAARAQATAALQEKIETYVIYGLDNYESNGKVALEEPERNQVITATKGVINGVSVLDTRKLYNPNTKMYKYEVCVTYDREGILSAMQAQSDIIIANEEQFEQSMQQAWDELDAKNNTNK